MAKKNPEEVAPVYIVKQEFRDINNFNIRYDIGEDVSNYDKDALDRLEALGVVSKEANDK